MTGLWLTVFSGSLFIPMQLHAVVDMVSGRIMGAAMQVVPVEASQPSHLA